MMARLKTARPVALPTEVPALLGIAALLLLSGCDNGPSAVSKQAGNAQAGGTQMATANAPERSVDGRENSRNFGDGSQVDHRKDVVAAAEDGKPMWAPSRRSSADDGAQRAFERNGQVFETKSVDQFVRKAHAFVGHPPKGTLTITRKNGDTLFYDPKANTFAVANKDGAPRTMFKPDDGMAYWEKQKDREAHGQTARGGRRRSSDDQA